MLEKIALQKNLITEEQCAEAQAACRSSGNYEVALKEYFVTRGLIPADQMKHLVSTFHALKIMRKNALFGRIAVKLGIVTHDALQTEIARQKQAASQQQPPRFLGDLWLKNGKITKAQLVRILQIQKKTIIKQTENKSGTAPATIPADTPAPEPDNGGMPDPEAVNELKADTESPGEADPGFACRREVGKGMVLEIDEVGMNAWLYKSDNFDDTATVDDILEILTRHEVISGIVDEGHIQGFIKSGGFKTKPFRVARGRERIQGKDARVEYYFDTDHLKAGGLDENGNIDFKDRGEIPWVQQGTLLAEKFAMEESRDGQNLFGHILEVVPTVDVLLKCRDGALLSDDESKVHAQISGHPRLSWSGNIHVTDTFKVDGNVNYQTGHLEYAGNIEVAGSLKSGFRIKGHDIRIQVVDGGEILADGDVVIRGGVNGARINARGHVSAKFIHNSEIFCLGNLNVEKEIVDSSVVTSGALIMPRGELISSKAVSNRGIQVRHMGTDKSIPNTVTFGVDAFTNREIKMVQKKISGIELRIEQIREKREAVERDTRGYHESTARLAHSLDRAREDGLGLAEKMEAPDDPETRPSALKAQYQKNRALFARLDKDLNACFDKIERNENRIMELQMELEMLEDEMDDLQYELVNFAEWKTANPGAALAVITGNVTAGTVVKGPHSQKEIKEGMVNVKIREVVLSDGAGGCEIQIHDDFKRK